MITAVESRPTIDFRDTLLNIMRILDRYILGEFVRYFFAALLALCLIFFIADYLRGVWDAEVSPMVLFKYSAYQIPLIIVQMIPPAAMLGTSIALSLMNRKNELTAMHASGISLMHIGALIFGAIFIASCFSLILSDRIVPPLARKRTAFFWKEIKNRPDFSMDIKTSKIWYRSKNYIYNIRFYDKKTETVQGLGVYYFNNDFKLMQHIEAEFARFDKGKDEWQLTNGLLTIFPEDGGFPLSKHFDKKDLKFNETPKDFIDIEKQVESLRLRELRAFIRRNKEAGLDTKVYEVDFHSRIAVSFLSLIMGLIAIPYSVRPKRQGGLAKDLSFCVAWIFSYWLLFSISLSLGKSGAAIPSLAVWLPCLVYFIIAIFLVARGRVT